MRPACSTSRKRQKLCDKPLVLGLPAACACHLPGSGLPATHGKRHAIGSQSARSKMPVRSVNWGEIDDLVAVLGAWYRAPGTEPANENVLAVMPTHNGGAA